VSRQRAAKALAILTLVAALAATVARQNGWWLPRMPPSAGATPQDAVNAMLDAARDGDVKRYLAAYTGSIETALRHSVAESSDAQFRKYLLDTNAALKGVAVTAPEATASDREVKVRVEFVYQDRSEAQTMDLEKTASGWKIARVDSAERVKTLVPYGTPVQ